MTTLIRSAETLAEAIDSIRREARNGQVLIVADNRFPVQDAFEVEGGEKCKNLRHVEQLWHHLRSRGATRSSLLLAIGGGSVTDMAGFAAACFKRGIDTAYVPTTILAAADAAVGGKTGVNFDGLKNEIGAFHEPVAVTMVADLWRTLPYKELASGYAEILKTALLKSAQSTTRALAMGYNLAEVPDYIFPAEDVAACARFKLEIAAQDFHDNGLRKQLNLGHTLGHALESYSRRYGQPLTHGHAVAIGLTAAAVLSNLLKGFESVWVEKIAAITRSVYESYSWNCDDFDMLLALMSQDKKNRTAEAVSFTLLSSPGHPIVDCECSQQQIRTALDITRDLLHI